MTLGLGGKASAAALAVDGSPLSESGVAFAAAPLPDSGADV